MADAIDETSQGTLATVSGRDAPPADLRAWWMVLVLFGLYVLSFVDRYALTMVTEPIKADFGLSDFEVGLLIGPAFSLSFAIFGLPFGWAADRYPRRWVIWVGVTMWSLMTMTSGLATSFTTMLMSRVGVGIGEASISPSAYSLMGDRFPRERLTTALSVYAMAPKVGLAVAFAVGGLVIGWAEHLVATGGFFAHFRPWQLTFLLIGVPSLGFSLLAFTFTEPRREGRASNVERAKLLPYLRDNKQIIGLMMVGFGCVGALGPGLNQWVPAFMQRSYGWGPASAGPALGLVSTIAACLLPVFGVVVDRLYKRGVKDAHVRFYTWLLIPLVPVSAAAFLTPNPYVSLACYTFVQAVALPFMLYLSATIQIVVPNELRGRVIALFLFFISTVPGSLGPVVIGALTDRLFRDPAQLGSAMALVAPIGCLGAFLLLRMALRWIGPEVRRIEAIASASSLATNEGRAGRG